MSVIATVEESFSCTPLRRVMAAIVLAGGLGALTHWFLTGPLTDRIASTLSEPLVVHDASIETPVVKPGSTVVIRLVSTKVRDCPGIGSAYLVDDSFHVWNLPENYLGMQPAAPKKKTVLRIRLKIPPSLPSGKYRLVRVLDYECPKRTFRVRFPPSLFFQVQ